MEMELVSGLQGTKRKAWEALLTEAQLDTTEPVERTVLLWDGNQLAAAGSRQKNVLKCIAVAPQYQGDGLMAVLMTHLRQDAFAAGYRHLFVYTKPANRWQFQSLFFYPVAQTDRVLLLENRRDGIEAYLNSLPAVHTGGKIGACVMNCNPFTRGHRYLIEQAASECDWVYVFVLSEDASRFSAEDRLQMVKLGTADLPNVTVYPTGPYLISSATFPSYFIKERDKVEEVYCRLDVEVFAAHYAPRFSITHRFVGTEPLSALTARYNDALRQWLPTRGITVREIPRLEQEQAPVSATTVRQRMDAGQVQALDALLPASTITYLQEHCLL